MDGHGPEGGELFAACDRSGTFRAPHATNGVSKVFDPSRFDQLFALVGDGRRWVIPSGAIEGISGITLGGAKYSEFEVDPAAPIEALIYGDGAPLESGLAAGEYASGQSTGSVKPWTLSSQVRILPPPLPPRESGFKRTKYDRKLGRSGQTTINEKRKVTLPQQAVLEAGLDVGDRLRVQSHGYGRIVLERIGLFTDVQSTAETSGAAQSPTLSPRITTALPARPSNAAASAA
jgi:bifunctional DNA-binding transcriptional regulator/antitoxin component of YhaV-PrlF toxin-antitoxin module